MKIQVKRKKAKVKRITVFGAVFTFYFLLLPSARAASNVTFQLDLGGNTHAATCQAGGLAYFTQGNSADNQVFTIGPLLTWDTQVHASGIQAAPPGGGVAIYGVASFTFNLELRSGSVSGPLVAVTPFLSTTNNGAAGC